MRFGFGFVPTQPLSEGLRVVQWGEQLGYEMAWIPDQTFFRDPFLVMAHWAQATENIQLMIGVTNPYTRHPAQVARAIATVDEISGGRAHLGIGSGNRRELLLPMGYEQDAAAARTREMVTLVRALLHGETLQHESAYVTAKVCSFPGNPRTRLSRSTSPRAAPACWKWQASWLMARPSARSSPKRAGLCLFGAGTRRCSLEP